MPWTKINPESHDCGIPAHLQRSSPGDEWTCEGCGSVWTVNEKLGLNRGPSRGGLVGPLPRDASHLEIKPAGAGSTRKVDLRGDGLLWLINRVVFHPRGYALSLDTRTGELYLLGDGSEPWTYENCGHGERAHLEAIKRVMP